MMYSRSIYANNIRMKSLILFLCALCVHIKAIPVPSEEIDILDDSDHRQNLVSSKFSYIFQTIHNFRDFVNCLHFRLKFEQCILSFTIDSFQ